MNGPANSRARPSSRVSSENAHAQPRRRPRPRASASPISSPGAASTARYSMASRGVNTAPMSPAASSVDSSAAPRWPRIRSTMIGSGETIPSGSRKGTAAAAEKTNVEATAALSTPLVRGSGASRAGTDTGMDAAAPLFRRERQQRDVARALDGERQLALVLGAGPEHPPGKHLAALRHERRQQLHVLVVHVVDLVRAELADLAAAEEVALARVLLVAAGPAALGVPSA